MSFLQNQKTRKNETKKEIIDLLSKTKAPVDVNFIISKVKSHRATIFRSLNKLVNTGDIKRLDFQEKKARYELAKDHHHHLICENCGKIEKISNCIVSNLEEKVNKEKKFLIKSHSLEFFGLCHKCHT